MEVESIPIDTIGSSIEMVNEGNAKNLSIQESKFPPGTNFQVGGVKHELTYLAIQSYPESEGFVNPHQENEDVTEAYFPLWGAVDVSLENPKLPEGVQGPRRMATIPLEGKFTKEQVNEALTNKHVQLITNESEPILRIVIEGQEYRIPPIILPPGRHHSTSRSGNAEFVALKGRKVV